MADTHFIDQDAGTPIVASWLNDVNKAIYQALGAAGVAPTTPAQVRANLGVQPTLISGTNIKTINGSSLLGSGDLAVVGGLVPTVVKIADYLVAVDELVRVNSSAGVFTISTPAAPADGAKIGILDIANACTAFPVAVTATAGHTIEGDAVGISINTNGAYVVLMYIEATANWKILDTPQGESGNVICAETSSLDSQLVLFSGVDGKTLKKAVLPGLLKSSALGVVSAAVSGTDVKTINGQSMLGAGDISVSGFRNRVINGDMRINQRVSGSAVPPGSFYIDRWFSNGGAGNAYNWSQAAGPDDAMPYSLLLGCSTAAVTHYLCTRIEDARSLQGMTVTLSYWAKCTSGTVSTSNGIQQNFGTGGSALVNNGIGGSNLITTTWQKFTSTATLPTTVGKTIGTSSYIELSFALPPTTQGVYLTGVQLEPGSAATTFEFRPYSVELTMCQRYYQVYGGSAYSPQYLCTAMSATAMTLIQTLPTPMRATPAFSVAGTVGNYPNPVFDQGSSSTVMLNIATTGLSTGLSYRFLGSADGTTKHAYSAEL